MVNCALEMWVINAHCVEMRSLSSGGATHSAETKKDRFRSLFKPLINKDFWCPKPDSNRHDLAAERF